MRTDHRAVLKVCAIEYLGNACHDCGLVYNGQNSIVFDFHHLDPTKKDFTIASELHGTIANAWDRIEAEVRKCALLCANCHRLRHG
jgi:integrase